MKPETAAEAAVWVARLHGPDRSDRMERECLAWQARSAEHRLAFERCTDTWQDVTLVSPTTAFTGAGCAGTSPRTTKATGRPNLGRRALAGVLSLGVVAVVVLFQYLRDSDTYSTGVGELRTVLLDDGTRLSLNTDTRVGVGFNASSRVVSIQHGEAVFEVAKDLQRPFVVRAAGTEVVALGTVFSVRLTRSPAGPLDAVAVALLEGRVSVRPNSDGDSARGLLPFFMRPGDRAELVTAAGSSSRVEIQHLEKSQLHQAVAWTRGEAIFENEPLDDAVAEMNRYSRKPITLMGDSRSKGQRISGMYRIGDNAGFAHAVAALYGFVLSDRDDHWELARGS